MNTIFNEDPNTEDIEYSKKIMFYVLHKKLNGKMNFKNIDEFYDYALNNIDSKNEGYKKVLLNYIESLPRYVYKLRTHIDSYVLNYIKNCKKFNMINMFKDEIVINEYEKVDNIYELINDVIYNTKHVSYQYETINKYIKNSLHKYFQENEKLNIDDDFLRCASQNIIIDIDFIYNILYDFHHQIKINQPKSDKPYIKIDNFYYKYPSEGFSKIDREHFRKASIDLKNNPIRLFN